MSICAGVGKLKWKKQEPKLSCSLALSSPARSKRALINPESQQKIPPVLCSLSLLPHKEPGTRVALGTPEGDLARYRPHPALRSPFAPSPLELEGRDPNGIAQASDRRWAQSSQVLGLRPHMTEHLLCHSLPLRPRPSRQILGGALRGGGGPTAKPAPTGSQSGLCLLQPGAQRNGKGPSLGQGPGQERREVHWHRRGPGPGLGGAGAGAQLQLLLALCLSLGN